MFELTQDEVASFRHAGFLGPFRHPLLHEDDAFRRRLIAALDAAEEKLAYPGFPAPVVMPQRLASGKIWYKSVHLIVPELWEVATHPAMLERVRSVIGPDVMWWATCITRKDPGEIHGWHYDAEFTTHRDGVLVFLGLDNLTPQSALKVITHTHRLRKNPIAYTSDVWRGKEGSPIVGDDARVVEIARTQDERAELVSPDMNTGDFFFAHAHAWHGSKNVSPLKRMSAVLCFGPPDVEVRIPMSFDDEPIFYEKLPSCAMLTGAPGSVVPNPIVGRPESRT